MQSKSLIILLLLVFLFSTASFLLMEDVPLLKIIITVVVFTTLVSLIIIGFHSFFIYKEEVIKGDVDRIYNLLANIETVNTCLEVVPYNDNVCNSYITMAKLQSNYEVGKISMGYFCLTLKEIEIELMCILEILLIIEKIKNHLVRFKHSSSYCQMQDLYDEAINVLPFHEYESSVHKVDKYRIVLKSVQALS